MSSTDAQEDKTAEPAVFSVTQENVTVQKRLVESETLRLRKIVHNDVVRVEEPLTTEDVKIERVSLNREVDAPVPVRYEGDVMIVSVIEERLVTRKQLVLTEEVRIRWQQNTRAVQQDVTLRREEILVERLNPATGEWEVCPD